jgi:undecaprenyl-diphosphatase
LRWWQKLGEPVPTLADGVRLTTSTEAALILFAVPAALVINRYRRAGGLAVAIAVLTMLVAQPVIKEVIDRPRPSAEQVDVRAEYDSNSFPSGHSMSTTAAWGAAALVAARHRRPRLAAALCVPIALTSVASLVQGVHWPSDSLAGLMLGGISAIGAAAVLRRAEHRSR